MRTGIPSKTNYDFVIIGGGSAGCALASRLSEDVNVSVLLLEAGGDPRVLDSIVPAAAGKLQNTDLVYNDFCEPQPEFSGQGLTNSKSYWPRGKALGGSSAVNYMAYVRGDKEDFNSWAKLLNDPTWSYEAILPLYKRMESCEIDRSSYKILDSSFHGTNGPLSVSVKDPVNPICNEFVRGAVKTGFKEGDYNGESSERVSIMQHTVRNGSRCTAADAYIFPNLPKRPNLEVCIQAPVSRILFDENKTAQAVEIILSNKSNKRKIIVQARKEIISSASAIGTPLLLLRSGIGQKNVLAQHSIPQIVESNRVGMDMEDHLMIPIFVRLENAGFENEMHCINKDRAENIPKGLLALFNWVTQGKGILSSSCYDATLFYKTGVNKDFSFPDAQIGIFCSNAGRDLVEKNLQIQTKDFIPDDFLADNAEGFIFVPTLLHPRSKSQVEMISPTDPLASPKITSNYLKEESDLTTLIQICLKCVEIWKAMKPYAGEILLPKDLKHLPLESEELWSKMCRRFATTLYHPSSSCKMGSVCDSNLKVKGVNNLRLADASVMPHNLSGNTNAVSMLIGEQAADFIIKDHKLNPTLKCERAAEGKINLNNVFLGLGTALTAIAIFKAKL